MAVISLKCPNCDGELIFDPSTKKYKCEYCTSLFTQEELDAMNQMGTEEEQAEETPAKGQQKETAEQEESVQEAAVYQCPNCGAEIVTDATTAASFCYYCHNPVVLGGRLSGEYLPDRIIPFSVTKEAALKGFEGYIGKKKFVPRAFFSKKQVESMSGVYFPYWTYDTQMKGSMQAEAAMSVYGAPATPSIRRQSITAWSGKERLSWKTSRKMHCKRQIISWRRA